LTAVSGIGKKTAEKIILELRGQISDLNFSNSDNEVVAALKAMGYTERDAQQAAKNATGTTTQDKIKSAHQKQAESKQLYREAEDLLLAELGLLTYQVKNTLSFSATKKEIEQAKRWDSEYFQPKYAEIIEKIERYEGGWDIVKNQFKQNTTLSKKDAGFSNYIEISDVNTSNGEIVFNRLETKDIPANGKRKLFKNDLLISKVRPYRGAISFIDFDEDNLLGSGAFTVLQEQGEYKKEVLMIFLKTIFIKELLLRYNCGTSYPVIKDEDILNLKIPLIKSSIQKQIAEKIQTSHRLRKESKDLLEEAKRKVEEEIEK
jgi:type I restriction enzyme S subunit